MKKKRFFHLIGVISILTAGVGICSAFRLEKSPSIKVIASIFPLKEFAQAVVGDWGEAELLLPPGSEVHAWQPRPSDLVKLATSHVFIYIGAQLEPWADDILRSVRNPGLCVIEASSSLSLMESGEEGNHDQKFSSEHKHDMRDPHIWLDFATDKKIIDKIAEALSRVDPERQAVFKKNAGIYKKKLDALDEKYRKTLVRCKQKTIVLGGHSAFGYLARRYRLSQISLYGLSPDSKPTPRQLMDIIDFIKDRQIKTIFFEANVSNELARVIARETGAGTLVLNPGATLPKGKDRSRITFLDIMEKNLENLKNGLRCR